MEAKMTVYKSTKAAYEIGRLRDGLAVLRILQFHGLDRIVIYDKNGEIEETSSIEYMVDLIENEEKARR
jgi:hypothetical protein